jgi:hypothetical protein
MRTPLQTCSRRGVVAVLASGVVITMSALTGGVAPALAKPGHDDPVIPIVPTTEVAAPPEAPQVAPQQEAPAEMPRSPKEPPAPPKVDSPPQQAPAPEIQAPAPQPEPPAQQAPAPQPQAPAPQVEAPPAPPKKEQPRVVDAPKFDAQKGDPPKVDTPKADPPKVDTPQVQAPKVDAPKADAPTGPNADAPKVDAPKADTPAPPSVADQPAKPTDPNQDAQVPRNLVSGQPSDPGADPAAPGKEPKADAATPGTNGPRDKVADPSDPSAVSKAAQRIPTAAPDTLKAPDADLELARQAKPVEVKPDPAAKQDVDFLSSTLNVSSKTKLGPFESDFKVGSDFSVGDRDRDWDRIRDRDHDHDWDWDKKNWDHKVRQWDRRWIQYDDFYRPIFYNPFRAPVRIVYLYERAPRIVILPPLGRVVVDAAALAAYSFTAVVLNAANLAADVAVGSFFGGGIIPPIGAPFVAPPPLLRYDNVPVQVRYSNATYQPFRVNQIVDLGDDVQYGGRKVLLDGATPAWGQWTTSPSGEREFEVHRTQEYPGLGDPQEAPLPGDYQMRLASDESANADHTQMYLMAAAGVIAGLGFGALGLAFYLGRRRPQL